MFSLEPLLQFEMELKPTSEPLPDLQLPEFVEPDLTEDDEPELCPWANFSGDNLFCIIYKLILHTRIQMYVII